MLFRYYYLIESKHLFIVTVIPVRWNTIAEHASMWVRPAGTSKLAEPPLQTVSCYSNQWVSHLTAHSLTEPADGASSRLQLQTESHSQCHWSQTQLGAVAELNPKLSTVGAACGILLEEAKSLEVHCIN